jgi:hypothetical protein
MAKSRTTPQKSGTLTEFPQPETAPIVPQGAVAVEEAPEEAEGIPEAFQDTPEAPRRRLGRPKKTDAPIETNFFRRVASVAPDDWGTRVYLYLYQLEPVCDLKQSGGKAYLMRYQEPVKDEHQIMLEQGSGKYRLVLALNKISPAHSNEMARYEFEIYNPKYPPKIPKVVWVNDPRNRRWEALLPKEPEVVAPTAASTIVDAMKMVSDIRRDVRDEMPIPEPPSGNLLDTIRIVKELMPQQPAAPAAPAENPLTLAVQLMTIMNQQKAENPVVDMLRDELKNMREELKEARKAQAPAAKPFLEQLLEMATNDKLEPIKKLLNLGGNGAGEAVGRATRTTMLDVFRDLATGPAGATLAQGVASMISNLAAPRPAPGQPQYPTVLNASQPNGTVPPVEAPEQRIRRIGETITRPLISHFLRGGVGDEFAQSMFDMQSEDYVFMRGLGAENIIQRYRQYPEAWNYVQAEAARFEEYIRAFCAWNPDEDEGPIPPGNGDDGVVDLESQEAGS